ncbi:MAG: tetratricopeptide repeat protein, partial [Saccharothrix sp.]|nr:tetratricopeptide repeat protein [Saccharothrix sp.]
IGALTFHRERGGDPTGAGRVALDRAFRFCVELGLSAAVVDLGERGRAVTDPDEHPADHVRFAQHAASALVALDRHDEALALYLDLRARTRDPKAQMVISYSVAMLYTRFFVPRDHDAALGWQNNACALASLLPDPAERRTYEVFQANGLALVEMHRGNLAHALGLVEEGLSRLDAELGEDQWVLHRSQLLYNRTRLLAALGRTAEAHEGFTRLIELDPHYTDYLSERAKLARKLGDLDAALADYDEAVRLGPPFPELYYNRGTARTEAGDVDGALADFAYVLEMEPDDLDTRLGRAELLLALGDTPAADADALAGLRLRPADPRLLAMRGAVAVEESRHADALDHLTAALAVDPDYPAALINRAVAHFHLGDPAASVADLTRALALTGDDPDVLLNRGIAHAAGGDLDAALSDYDRALALPDADAAELHYHRGLCLLRTTDRERAEADLRTCLDLGEHTDEITALLSTA